MEGRVGIKGRGNTATQTREVKERTGGIEVSSG